MTEPSAIASSVDASGSTQAHFAAMLEQHRGIVLKIAYSYCSNPDDQRDLVQDISVQLWRVCVRCTR